MLIKREVAKVNDLAVVDREGVYELTLELLAVVRGGSGDNRRCIAVLVAEHCVDLEAAQFYGGGYTAR